MDEKQIMQAALERYGAEAQTLMLFEEMSELQKELCKHSRGRRNTMAIAEEIADVQIMLEQMIMLHNCKDKVEEVRQFKLLRLENRLRSGITEQAQAAIYAIGRKAHKEEEANATE